MRITGTVYTIFERRVMARTQASRKYQLTINNPVEHGFTHEQIKAILGTFSSLEYWCMCDEVGSTPHTHLYVQFQSAVMFNTLKKRFYEAHMEPAQGSNQENRDYIQKAGKWAGTEKQETNLPETFEESGELPPDAALTASRNEAIVSMIRDGASDAEILAAFPCALTKMEHIDRARQTILEDKHRDDWRQLEVTYIWGKTGSGKTRSVMEKYGYANVYRVTNYAHPFDGYAGQDVIAFEEFRSSLPISEMLVYLDGYPVKLPCRYADKQACFTKVYIITNIPISDQYPNIQREEPETWRAFLRRFTDAYTVGPNGQPQRATFVEL